MRSRTTERRRAQVVAFAPASPCTALYGSNTRSVVKRMISRAHTALLDSTANQASEGDDEQMRLL